MHRWLYISASEKYRGGTEMVEKTINKNIIDSINKFIEEIKKKYNITAIILFGSYAKGTENEYSDIDIAVISEDFKDIYDSMAVLMGMTWEIDARIEPHPITKDDYEKISNPFIKEIVNTGIKVA